MGTSWEVLNSTSQSLGARPVRLTFKSMDRLYEPVEEHLRAAEALLDSRFGTGVRDRSQSPTLLGTPRESFAERRDITREDITEALGVVLGTDSGTLAAFKKFILAREVNTTESTGTSSEPHVLSPAQMQQAGPSRVYAISSPPSRVPSQYSIHSDSSEPLDRDSMSITTTPKSREPELPPLSSQSSRKTRPFKASTHSQGETVWMTAFTYEDLSAPPEPAPEDEPGVLYIHRNLSNDATRVWLLGSGMQWDVVQPRAKIQHPIFGDRYLTIRADGTPSWVILATWKKWVNSQ